MRIRVSTVTSLLLAAAVSLAAADGSVAQVRAPGPGAVSGFGRLSWGATLEQARAVYRDLYFGQYVVESGGREAIGVYYRKDEPAEIEGVGFDAIEYRFRENRFFGIRAVMRSRIGPRSLITRSEESFDRLHHGFVRKYGTPTRYDETYFTDFVTVTRVARWERPGATVVLRYRGPETTNEDELVFELREGGRP